MVLPPLKWTLIPILLQIFIETFSYTLYVGYHHMDVTVVVVVIGVVVDLGGVVFVIAFGFESVKCPNGILISL